MVYISHPAPGGTHLFLNTPQAFRRPQPLCYPKGTNLCKHSKTYFLVNIHRFVCKKVQSFNEEELRTELSEFYFQRNKLTIVLYRSTW